MRRLRFVARLAVLLLALGFMTWLLYGRWDELRGYPWRLHPLWLLPAVTLVLFSWLLEVAVWRRLLAALGGSIGYGTGFRIWFISAVLRYIPGNVWQPLGMTVLCRQHGVRPEATVAGVALYQAVNLLAAALIAACYVPLTGNLGLLASWLPPVAAQWVWALAAPVVVFWLRPQWLVRLLNRGLRWVGRPPLSAVLNRRVLGEALALELMAWLALGLGFAAVTLALIGGRQPERGAWVIHLVAGYPVAYAIGFLSLVTPSGLAVREAAMYVLAAPVVGGGLITVAALAMRVLLMVGEAAVVGWALLTWPGLLPCRPETRWSGAVQDDG
ncbi:MAG: flippase-like domain-containing protein [Caldilineales bacterium]|nr:flippase-like domain-containing protein [Caldilineales bacterium]